MKRARSADDDEMPAEFDFSRSIPNPWFVAVHGADYVRVINKDLAAVFPDDESVNTALRSVQKIRELEKSNGTPPKLKKNKKKKA